MVDYAAAGRTGIVRVIATCISAAVLLFMLTMIWRMLAISFLPDGQSLNFAVSLRDGSTPQAMFVILGSFALWFPALALSMRLVHDRQLFPVLGRAPLRSFFRVLNLLIAIHLLLLLLPPWDLIFTSVPNLDYGTWLILLPLSLLAVLIQSSAEEVFFRGYLQQYLAARFANPAVWMGVPSALFALGHYDGAGGSNTWLIVIWAGLFGLLMADLTARAGSLGPAIAVHFINNAVSILLLAVPGVLDGLALYTLPIGYNDEAAIRALLPVEFGMLIVAWIAARLAIRR